MILQNKGPFLIAMIFSLMLIQQAFSQSNKSVENWFKQQYEYINPNLEVSKDSLKKLTNYWHKATDKNIGAEERQQALQNLIETMVHIQGVEQQYNAAAISTLVSGFRSIKGLSTPPSREIKGSRQRLSYDHVQPIGTGEKHVILLSDVFADVSIYEPFIEQNLQEFTFHPINLPGIGDTPSLSLPKTKDFVLAPWFTKTELAIINYIEERSISNPIIIGTWGSGYLAARLAKDHPTLFDRAVLINAPINMLYLLDSTNPTGLSPVQARINYLKNEIPNIFPFPDKQSRHENNIGFAEFYTSNKEKISHLINVQSEINPKVIQQYVGELFAQDYSNSIKDISIPLLSLTSLYEPNGTPGSGAFQLIVNEWEKTKLDYPEAPITHVIYEDTRAYIPLDAANELTQTISGFLEGKVIDPQDADPSERRYQLSSRVMHRGMIGATPIEIDYGSPAMRGRDIFGNIVRFDSPWRAGANNITNIKFYKDVRINSKEIPKGRYGFFVIPHENNPWDVVLTGYAIGAGGGSFVYDSTYKFFSSKIDPIKTHEEEHLRYFVEQKGLIDGVMGFTWAGMRIVLDIEAPSDVNIISKHDLHSVQNKNWTLLASEDKPDAANTANADAKRVSYDFNTSSDMLWFKIELEKTIDHTNIGFNLVIDGDLDQSTGSSWWGNSNGSFIYDRLGTLFVRETNGGKYAGTIGVSDDEYLLNSDFTHEAVNSFRLALDEKNNIWYIGVPLVDIDEDGQFDFSIAVGSSSSWNDDIPNGGSMTLKLPVKNRTSLH